MEIWSFAQIYDLFCTSSIKVWSQLLMMRMMMWKTDTLSDAFTAEVRARGEKRCQSPPHLIVLLQDGGWSADALSLHRLQLSSQAHSELRST